MVVIGSIKKKSIRSLADGILKFEDKKDGVKNSDYSDLKTFVKSYLNTSEPKQRKKIAEEFKKRHLELYEFIKDNGDLISADMEISKAVQTVVSGKENLNADTKPVTILDDLGE